MSAVLPLSQADTATMVSDGRMRFLDLLRAVAAQLIVWHHLAFYGPLSDVAYPVAPGLMDALYDYARMAVQVFLVIGGFITAQQIQTLRYPSWVNFRNEIIRRYRRIGGPYLVTLISAIGANALADRWMNHPSISAAPTFMQLVAHAVFIQDIFNFEALTAGIWYLAIDFQLFVLGLAIAMWSLSAVRALDRTANERSFRTTQRIFTLLAVASLFWFNRIPELDRWAIYFFGSYFLGMVVRWSIDGHLRRQWLMVYLLLMLAAVLIEWRPRLIVAGITGLLIFIAAEQQVLYSWPRNRLIAYLGQISFSLFLVHFPTCLVINAWLSRYQLSPTQSFGGMVLAYLVSLMMAVLFHHVVEVPCVRFARKVQHAV